MNDAMTLEILLPTRVFLQRAGVRRINAETAAGSLGLLPHRLDCVAALRPGILAFESATEGEVFVATDEGVLVKSGPEVRVSTRRAIVGGLAELRRAVDREFRARDADARALRELMAKLETGFIRRLSELRRG
jgi:F-type H+-transporting ATPase subunit epsilon